MVLNTFRVPAGSNIYISKELRAAARAPRESGVACSSHVRSRGHAREHSLTGALAHSPASAADDALRAPRSHRLHVHRVLSPPAPPILAPWLPLPPSPSPSPSFSLSPADYSRSPFCTSLSPVHSLDTMPMSSDYRCCDLRPCHRGMILPLYVHSRPSSLRDHPPLHLAIITIRIQSSPRGSALRESRFAV